MVKNLLANAGDIRDMGSIPGWGRFPGEGNANPLQYSCLENLMDRGAWQATWGHKESDITEVSQHAWLQARVGGTELGYNMNLTVLKK